LRELFDSARHSLLDVFIGHKFLELDGTGEQAGPVLRGRVADLVGKLLAQIKNPVEQEMLAKSAAQLIGVSETALMTIVGTPRRPKPQHAPIFDPMETSAPRRTAPSTTVSSNVPRIRPEEPKQVDSFSRAVVMALLIEPTLAEEIQRLRSLEEPHPLVIDLLPEQVRSFVAEVAAERPEPAEDSSLWRRLLEEHDLTGMKLIEEALERAPFELRVREKMVDELLRQAPLVMARRTILDKVEQTRAEERLAQDDTERARLMQQKILQRRRLDNLKSGKGNLPEAQ